METKSYNQEGIQVIEIHGDLDGSSSPQLQEEVERVITPDCRCLALDMTGCKFVSSAGLRVLLIFAKLMKKNDGNVILAGLCEEVEEIMEMTGFDPYFQYHDTIEDAVKAEKSQ